MITKISKKNISKIDICIVIIFNIISILLFILLFKPSLNNLDFYFLTLPVVMIITTVIHEYIHVIFFKLFGKGKAHIKIMRNKDIKGIVVLQQNKDVKYSLNQILIILLSPLIIITVISLLLSVIALDNINLIIGTNMWLNCIGSTTDVVLSFKRYKEGEGATNFEYTKEEGVVMNIEKERES